MSLLIVPEPLFNSEMSVEAYRLCSHDGSKIFNVVNLGVIDDVFAHPGLEIVEKVGLEPFTGGKKMLVDISHMQLINKIPLNMNIDTKHLICILPAEVLTKEEDVKFIYNLLGSGCEVGIKGLPSKMDLPIMTVVKYIVLDYRSSQFSDTYYYAKRNFPNVKTVICNIPDPKAFSELRGDTMSYFAGNFYNQPITKDSSVLSPLKVNLLHLLSDVNQEDFDLTDIVKTIERDPYLTISLLKFINSGSGGIFRNIESIQQAIAILGQKAVRQWASIALSVELAEDRPSEIIRLSLLRAKFAEQLAPCFELGVFQSELFITGLFSLLDVMLEKPMESALEEVSVNERIREVLLNKSGDFAPLMSLVNAYERGDWDKATILMIQNNIDMEQVRDAYLNALNWYKNLLQTIDEATHHNP